jgi:4-amino-4-deoxy-L-arabinose transferase-like glycosyltransferase
MDKRTTAVLLLTAAVRLSFAATTPLFPDETYFWDWSRHLATGYFDHPPLIAWLIRAGTFLLGDTVLGVRLGPVVAGVIGTVLVVATARRLAGDRAALGAATVLAVMPLSAAGLMLATPDAGLFACIAAVVYCVVRALDCQVGSRSSLAWWSFAGLAQGLAFWTKYTAVLVPAGLAVALLSRVEWRSRLREPGPYIGTLVAIAVFLPVFVWNARHNWQSFTFQLQHGLSGSGGSILRHESEFIGSQLGLVSPILFAMMVVALWNPGGSGGTSASPLRLLSPVAWLVLSFFMLSATRRRPEANWPAVAYVPATLVLVSHARSRRWDRWLNAGIAVAGTMTLVTYVNTFVPILTIAARHDPAARASGWAELAQAVRSNSTSDSGIRYPPSAIRLFIAGNRYQEASELAFHLPGQPRTFSLNLGSRSNQYDFWPSFADRAAGGDTLIFVTDDLGSGLDPVVSALTPHFADVGHGRPVSLARRGDVTKHLRIWTLAGWRGTWPTPPLRSRP